MKKQITVTVSGPEKSGKSRIIYLIKEMLRDYAFDISFDPTPDFDNELNFDLAKRVVGEDDIQNISNIIIKEVIQHIKK